MTAKLSIHAFWVINLAVKFAKFLLCHALCAAGIWLGPALCAGAPAANASSPPRQPFVVDRSSLPPALREVNLKHLSSGALMLLNKNNNLVRPSPAWSAQAGKVPSVTTEAPRVALDLRVGAN